MLADDKYSSEGEYVFHRKRSVSKMEDEGINQDISEVGRTNSGSEGISNRYSTPNTPPEIKGNSQKNKNILQIANSFLNSPIMKHFSMDEKEEQEEEEFIEQREQDRREVQPSRGYSMDYRIKSEDFRDRDIYPKTREEKEGQSENLLGLKYKINRVESFEMNRGKRDFNSKSFLKQSKPGGVMSFSQNMFENDESPSNIYLSFLNNI